MALFNIDTYTHIHVCVCETNGFTGIYVCLKLGKKQILNLKNHFENKRVVYVLGCTWNSYINHNEYGIIHRMDFIAPIGKCG